LGWAQAVVAWVAIFYGWEAYEETFDTDGDWNACLAGIIVLVVLYAALELNYRYGHLLSTHPILECRSVKLPAITHKEATERIIVKGQKLVFYDDLVLDITRYRWSHPGGAIMFERCIGEDMGKFIQGCSSIGGSFNPYTHSEMSKKLCRQLAIGRIPYNTNFLRWR
jgi:hypothetical protein